MKKVWAFVKKYYEVIGYAVLSLLLLGACFVQTFAWLAGFAAIVLGILLRNESKIFGLILFMYCFYRIMYIPEILTISLELIVSGVLIFEMFCWYVYRVIKHEYKLNWKTLIPIGLFLVYLVLPFHQCGWREFFAEVFFLGAVYIVFEERLSMDFRALVRVFAAGLLISCVYSTLYSVSPLLYESVTLWWYNGVVRFSGLMYHPNTLNGMVFITICGVLLLYYQKKISLVEMLVEFVSLFVCGYLTLSRAFLVTIIVGVGIFVCLYLIKERKQALVLSVVLVAIMCLVGGLFFHISRAYFERISDGLDELPRVQSATVTSQNFQVDFESKSPEEQQAILEGRALYDPGRHGLRQLYWRDWTASPKSILLGYGISKPLIGQMSSHNLYLQELWKHGLIGFGFYLAMIIGAVNWKKIKQCKIYLPILIMLVPYFLVTIVEECFLDFVRIGFMLAALGFLEQIAKQQMSKISTETAKSE